MTMSKHHKDGVNTESASLVSATAELPLKAGESTEVDGQVFTKIDLPAELTHCQTAPRPALQVGDMVHYYASDYRGKMWATPFAAVVTVIRALGEGQLGPTCDLTVLRPGGIEHTVSRPYSETPAGDCWTFRPDR